MYHSDPKQQRRLGHPRLEPDTEGLEGVLWETMAPDSFAPDKPDQEIDQILSYQDTHPRRTSKRSTRKKR